MTPSCRLPRCQILKSSARIRDLFQSGRRLHGRYITVYIANSERPRAAFVVPKRYGKAVLRNQQKRRLREIYRQHKNWFPGDQDVVLYMRPLRKRGEKGPRREQPVPVFEDMEKDLCGLLTP